MTPLEIIVALVVLAVVAWVAWEIHVAPTVDEDGRRIDPDENVTRLPARLRLVQGGLDRAGAEAESVVFDWHGPDVAA